MRSPKTKAEGPQTKSAILRKQMDDLKAELKRVEVEEEASFGRMARRAGLFELNVPEKELREAVAALVESFRAKGLHRDDGAASSPT